MSQNRNVLIVITGPTAVGKSSLALELAHELSTEIISADSRQIYRRLDIATAKPSRHELSEIKHHFIDHLDLTERYTATQYARECLALMHSLFTQYETLIMVGGTGLYLRAVLEGFDEIPAVPSTVQEKWNANFASDGLEYLQNELSTLDPKYAQVVDMGNARRLIRALSVQDFTGLPYSSFLKGAKKPLPYRILPICLVREKEALYERINNRVDEMLSTGLVAEAKSLLMHRELQALQTVGYQELFPHFDGEYDLEEGVRLIKRNSRRYAKRQMTWLRKYGEWEFLEAETTSVGQLLEKTRIFPDF